MEDLRRGRENQRVEHLGDAAVLMAARLMAYRAFPSSIYAKSYNVLHTRLVSNENLMSAGYPSGDAAEVEIGQVVLRFGVQAGVERAERILSKTDVWKVVSVIVRDATPIDFEI